MALRFDGQTVILTGASHGLGRHFITYIARQGANVIVHDDKHPDVADELAAQINAGGGKAIASSTSLQNGRDIVEAAIAAFGRLDALVLNAADCLDLDWEASGRNEWDSMLESTFTGCYKCVTPAWSHFKKQKYGRILCTSAIAETNSSCSPLLYSAKYGQLGFIQTIAREGAKYNILASVLAPPATAGWMRGVLPPSSSSSSETETESIVKAVAMLIHPSNKKETGHLYEISEGVLHKLRWQRSPGALLNPDASMTPGAILDRWSEVTDFSRPEYPSKAADFEVVVAQAKRLPPSPAAKANAVRLDGKVALVTGAGAGLGGAYAKCLASLGARVVLNDVKEPSKVAAEIQAAGGETPHMVTCSVEEGEKIVEEAVKKFGRLDIIVNNAGFVRDKSIANMTDDLWNAIMGVHLKGTFRVTRAAWPHLMRQGYGKIINVTSTSGIYGNFGQSNYSTAKAAIIGFSDALARLGAEHNIHVSTVAPVASTTALAAAVQGSSAEFLPDYCGPFVAVLSSDAAPFPSTGGLFEFGAGWHTRTRLQRSSGSPLPFKSDEALSPDAVERMWSAVADFDRSPPTYPEEDSEHGLREVILRLPQNQVLATIEDAKRRRNQGTIYEYGDREVLLYNLTLGATWDELSLVNERDKGFQVLPTFGVIPFFTTKLPFSNEEILPNWDPNRFLHGEHYLELRKFPIPTSGRLITTGELLDVQDKKKAALVTVGFTTRDAVTGEDVFYNESSLYGRGAGGFTGPTSPPPSSSSMPSPSTTTPPKRTPDFTRSQTTTLEQATFYRLNGDRNSIHVDPTVAQLGGFPRPILHGLCFLGISAKHIFQRYGPFKNIRVRFAGTVLPGETLRTEMWEKIDAVLFQTVVVETGKVCMSGGRVELRKQKQQGRGESRL